MVNESLHRLFLNLMSLFATDFIIIIGTNYSFIMPLNIL